MSESDGFESRKRRSSRSTQPQPDPLTCPRCESTNTKFCYYNNYNKTQPRFFCKSCKRHWTNGGILRNVPAGGGRKNKRLRRPAVITTTTTTDQETYDYEQKSSFFGSTSGEKEDDESYTDIEELKALVGWDLPFTRFLSPFDANPCSYIQRSFIEMFENDEDSTSATSVMMSSSQETSKLNWDDLDALVLDDLNKPWEDPTFKT